LLLVNSLFNKYDSMMFVVLYQRAWSEGELVTSGQCSLLFDAIEIGLMIVVVIVVIIISMLMSVINLCGA